MPVQHSSWPRLEAVPFSTVVVVRETLVFCINERILSLVTMSAMCILRHTHPSICIDRRKGSNTCRIRACAL